MPLRTAYAHGCRQSGYRQCFPVRSPRRVPRLSTAMRKAPQRMTHRSEDTKRKALFYRGGAPLR